MSRVGLILHICSVGIGSQVFVEISWHLHCIFWTQLLFGGAVCCMYKAADISTSHS